MKVELDISQKEAKKFAELAKYFGKSEEEILEGIFRAWLTRSYEALQYFQKEKTILK